MPHLKASSMRDMSPDELQARVAELREELFNLRFRNSLKQLDNALKIRESRREMARLLTVLNEKLRTQAPAAPKAISSAIPRAIGIARRLSILVRSTTDFPSSRETRNGLGTTPRCASRRFR